MIRKLAGFGSIGFLVSAASCSSSRLIGDYREPPASGAFESQDAGELDAEPGLISYCPSNKCPAGYTTCPDSFFPCDVDLETDLRHCGACGAACPQPSSTALFSCINGQCVLECKERHLDCDRIRDNGCEVYALSTENCGACGNKCPENHPCLDGKCGCPGGLTYCAGQCVDTKSDDTHCGMCANSCDPAGGPTPAPPHMYWGCYNSECAEADAPGPSGTLKCERDPATQRPWGDCDDVLGNGCETQLGMDTNCAACGDNCLAKGQKCLRSPELQFYCGCPAGTTFCGSCRQVVSSDGDGGTLTLEPVCTGRCADLTSDGENCGGCGLRCSLLGTCEYGSCVEHCPFGRADCDGSLYTPFTGRPACEVNTLSDPQNCGGCGIVCDAIAGQACAGGQCVVEPCAQNDGGVTR